MFLGGLKEEEVGSIQDGGKVMSEGEVLEKLGVRPERILEGAEKVDGGIERVEREDIAVSKDGDGVEEVKVGSGNLMRIGGPLDQAAEGVVEKVKKKGGWLNWGR